MSFTLALVWVLSLSQAPVPSLYIFGGVLSADLYLEMRWRPWMETNMTSPSR